MSAVLNDLPAPPSSLPAGGTRRTAARLEAGLSFEPLEAALGARVRGLDIRRRPSAAQVLAIQAAFREHLVLIFEGQQADDEQYLRFVTHFGSVFQPPNDVPVLASDPYGGNTPAIVKVANVEGGLLGHAELSAHADHHWTPLPSASSFLLAERVPTQGGQTLWTNLALAWDTLDAATQAEIADLQLITYNPFLRRLQPLPSGRWPLYRTPDITPLTPHEAHPLVRTHPHTGRRLLWLDEATEVELVGLDPAHGQALIERLRTHLRRPELTYEHHWQVGDLVWWDNAATLHARKAFDASQTRLLKRISLAGSRPF